MKVTSPVVLGFACASLAHALASEISVSSRQAQACGNPSDAVPFYRTYNEQGVDHWYTPDPTAVNIFLPQGYNLEGVLGLVFLTQEEGTAPLYHLNSSSAIDNFYTMSASEVATAEQSSGYSDVGNPPTLYIYATQVCGSIPVYRLYSPVGTDHFYTNSEGERNRAISVDEYVDEGIVGYVLPLGCTY